MSKRTTELLRALAIVALGGATVHQLVGLRSELPDEGNPTPAAVANVAAERILAELRRMEAGSLIGATNRSIVLRVPAEIGVVCANDARETVIAALPAAAAESVQRTSAQGMGWYAADGEFEHADGTFVVRATVASACLAASVDAPEGSTFLAVSPAAPAAHVGAPAVLFDRVEYALRASARGRDTLSLWRTADGTAREVVAGVAGDAAFRFFVDASAVATATVPAPLGRIRGIELSLPAAASDGAEQAPTAVFFRNAAS